VRGVRRALRAMRGGLVIGAGGALHGARIVCDAMRCARAGCIRAVRCDARDAQADALRRSMRCELFAMQCAARGLVAFARCRRHHAFDGGILRVGGEGLRYGRIGGRYVRYGRMGERRVRVRGVYRFSSLVKQNKKGKNCAVFCFAGKRKLVFYILRCDCEAKNL